MNLLSDVHVHLSRIQTSVSQEELDRSYVGSGFKQMGGKGMT